MNKIERALIDRAKRLLMEYATEELENYKKKLNEKTGAILLDVFNTGIMLDVNKIQLHGIEHLETSLKKRSKTTRKT